MLPRLTICTLAEWLKPQSKQNVMLSKTVLNCQHSTWKRRRIASEVAFDAESSFILSRVCFAKCQLPIAFQSGQRFYLTFSLSFLRKHTHEHTPTRPHAHTRSLSLSLAGSDRTAQVSFAFKLLSPYLVSKMINSDGEFFGKVKQKNSTKKFNSFVLRDLSAMLWNEKPRGWVIRITCCWDELKKAGWK